MVCPSSCMLYHLGCSYLACCIRVGSSFQQQLGYIHFSILGGHVQWSEAFL